MQNFRVLALEKRFAFINDIWVMHDLEILFRWSSRRSSTSALKFRNNHKVKIGIFVAIYIPRPQWSNHFIIFTLVPKWQNLSSLVKSNSKGSRLCEQHIKQRKADKWKSMISGSYYDTCVCVDWQFHCHYMGPKPSHTSINTIHKTSLHWIHTARIRQLPFYSLLYNWRGQFVVELQATTISSLFI